MQLADKPVLTKCTILRAQIVWFGRDMPSRYWEQKKRGGVLGQSAVVRYMSPPVQSESLNVALEISKTLSHEATRNSPQLLPH